MIDYDSAGSTYNVDVDDFQDGAYDDEKTSRQNQRSGHLLIKAQA